MKIKTSSDYMSSLQSINPVIYYKGEKIKDVTLHPATAPHVRAAAMTYALASQAEHHDLATATSHLTGRKISRFTHVHQNVEDLLKKVKLLRILGQKTGTCFQRCVGFDGINAVYSVVYEVDEKLGTDYLERFKQWLTYIQDENLMVVGAMTDPKGDRSKNPSEQPDPDQFVRVVERRNDGIVVRGAKLHMTGAVNSHEILIMPTMAMDEKSKDYAFVGAIPVDAPGIIMVFGRQAGDDRRDKLETIDVGKPRFGSVGGEAMIIFDDVFIPNERVFLDGETEFTASIVYRFAAHHRSNYGACKTGLMDVLTGAVSYLCQIQGAAKGSHVRDKVTEMIHLSETLYSSSIACSAEGVPTESGAYMVDTMLANVCKQNVTRFHFEVARLAVDLAGGFIATLPSEHDLKSDEVGHLVKKYFTGVADIPVEERIKIGRLIEAMTGGTALVESMHGAGSPQAQRIMIFREGDLTKKVSLAKALAGIPSVKPKQEAS
ncbi:4-hydroxyphenylacetate 3-hydroxylase family protein [Desulfotignum phosphitoxidans]|uniref:4-hydroxybutyryl-CoA dehydratase/vinylacetyl-CoA-delta-isomerase AbfD n=1 Tax=Desulfotignum phosphitoxidans DSM 13687 TaxID=1286635 RepID=S0G554_9BACT|nr:4-hydroxyphenylacetate 3-hydroxylase N-terminal domain-containing protein [Desulfotignum phosphitoxidans]EMS80944.1 4-hydroxybutyryl-CoA dehydratase/vinylacetyl-CoA-delta-isomerase AbfD [Desulfotignum phosphitoxidans DSM 13687]